MRASFLLTTLQLILLLCKSLILRQFWMAMVAMVAADPLKQEQPSYDDHVEPKAPVSLGDVEAAEGGQALLSCGLNLPSVDDAIYLVLWFLEPYRKPIYTVDVRGKPWIAARHWSETSAFGPRAYFRVEANGGFKGHLVINNLTREDEGLYRCRVDFRNSPTRHFRVHLTVIVPPSVPVIYDSEGQVIRSPVLGPLKEGSVLMLQCDVAGGRPAPEVTWWLDRYKLPARTGTGNEDSWLPSAGNSFTRPLIAAATKVGEGSIAASFDKEAEDEDNDTSSGLVLTVSGESNSRKIFHLEPASQVRAAKPRFTGPVIRKVVAVGPLGRPHHGAQLSCQATNSLATSPAVRTLTIDMHIRPLLTEILPQEHQRFSANEKSEIRCRSLGSRPPAHVTWWRESYNIPNATEVVSEDGNVTISILKFTPTVEDNGRLLTCRAVNPVLDASAVEDTLRLDVQFAPVASLRLGPTLNPDLIKEGDDVYFECSVHANPPAHRLIWKNQGRILVHNITAGVVVSNTSLAIRSVTRSKAGEYSCAGINVKGEGQIGTVNLTVRYVPYCQQSESQAAGAEKGETVTLQCGVHAHPPPSRYRWAINSSHGWKDVPLTSILPTAGVEGVTSSGHGGTRYLSQTTVHRPGLPRQESLRFRPQSDADFATIACWALNDIGWQREPCLFKLTAAGPPHTLQNCAAYNQTAESVAVTCDPAYDGGLKQAFRLEALDVASGHLLFTVQSDTPDFQIRNLEQGSTFLLNLYAINAKGRSAVQVLPVSTLKEAAKRTVPPASESLSSGLVGAVAVGTCALALVLSCFIALTCYRIRQQQKAREKPSGNGGLEITASADTELPLPNTQQKGLQHQLPGTTQNDSVNKSDADQTISNNYSPAVGESIISNSSVVKPDILRGRTPEDTPTSQHTPTSNTLMTSANSAVEVDFLHNKGTSPRAPVPHLAYNPRKITSDGVSETSHIKINSVANCLPARSSLGDRCYSITDLDVERGNGSQGPQQKVSESVALNLIGPHDYYSSVRPISANAMGTTCSTLGRRKLPPSPHDRWRTSTETERLQEEREMLYRSLPRAINKRADYTSTRFQREESTAEMYNTYSMNNKHTYSRSKPNVPSQTQPYLKSSENRSCTYQQEDQ